MFTEEFPLRLRRCKLFLERLRQDRFWRTIPLQVTCAHVGTRDLSPEEASHEHYYPLHEGERWGGPWENAWIRASVEIPEDWQEEELALVLNMSGECLVYDADNQPWYAVTGCSVFNATYEKDLFFPQPWMRHAHQLAFTAECTGSSLFGVNLITDPHRSGDGIGGDFEARAKVMRLGVLNREAWQLYYDYEVLYQLCTCQPEGSYRRRQLLHLLNAAADAYGDDPAQAASARRILAPELARPALSSAPSVYTVGHAHLDVAWLWTVQEGARKAVRTFASQLEMIRRYPGYVFGASQPQLYEFVRQRAPQLFEKIRRAVAEGSWELQGAMWVEADCNIPSGESLVRQLLHGQLFYQKHFGRRVNHVWLPDVFGYSAALPQLIRLSGCSYFLTQKLSWSQYNKFPHHSFLWQGIDGSRVLTHFPPEDSYSSEADPIRRTHAQDNYAQADVAPLFASLIGLGDGGGGSAEGHLEREQRVRQLEGCPPSHFSTASAFFLALESYRHALPLWDGELYLEMHRGTLTNQARTKRLHRQLEQALAALEWVASCLPAERYPRQALQHLWRTLLLHQFHDILPGSSIQQTYETTERELAAALHTCQELTGALATELCTPEDGAVTLINTLPGEWEGLVKLPPSCRGRRLVDERGLEVPVLEDRDGSAVRAWVSFPWQQCLTLRPAGAHSTPPLPADPLPDEMLSLQAEFPGLLWMANSAIAYGLDPATARLICLRDFQENRTLRFTSPGNDLVLYVDRPNNYEGWDIDQWYRTEGTPLRPSLVELGALEQSAAGCLLPVTYHLGASTIRQKIILPSRSRRLDFETTVDWHEQRRVLRVEFPVDLPHPRGFYEIQYGYVERPLHSNTSWDMAKFEVPCQRYIDLSSPDYGLALLNDGKYGSKLSRHSLELTLLRSALYPDFRHEEGVHHFTYSLLPHGWGNPAESSCIRDDAAALNRAPIILPAMAARTPFPAPYRLGISNTVRMEVLKRAELSDHHVIRLVETSGRVATCLLLGPKGAPSPLVANLLEDANPPEQEAYPSFPADAPDPIALALPDSAEHHSCTVLRLRPFQVLTLIGTQPG